MCSAVFKSVMLLLVPHFAYNVYSVHHVIDYYRVVSYIFPQRFVYILYWSTWCHFSIIRCVV